MMKKLAIATLAAVALTMGAASFAASSKVYVDNQPTIADKTTRLLHPYTDITIVTASVSPFYINIPGSGLGDIYMQNGTPNIHIHHNTNQSWPLVLKNIYQQAFFSQYVCPLAIVTV